MILSRLSATSMIYFSRRYPLVYDPPVYNTE